MTASSWPNAGPKSRPGCPFDYRPFRRRHRNADRLFEEKAARGKRGLTNDRDSTQTPAHPSCRDAWPAEYAGPLKPFMCALGLPIELTASAWSRSCWPAGYRPVAQAECGHGDPTLHIRERPPKAFSELGRLKIQAGKEGRRRRDDPVVPAASRGRGAGDTAGAPCRYRRRRKAITHCRTSPDASRGGKANHPDDRFPVDSKFRSPAGGSRTAAYPPS